MSRSKLCENGPEIVEKKYTVAPGIPDVTGKKKVRSVQCTICGVFRYRKYDYDMIFLFYFLYFI